MSGDDQMSLFSSNAGPNNLTIFAWLIKNASGYNEYSGNIVIAVHVDKKLIRNRLWLQYLDNELIR